MARPIPANIMGEDAFRLLEEEMRSVFNTHPSWAVTTEYSADKMEMRIVGVERWNFGKHYGKNYIIRVYNCRDEIDAYMEAKQQLEQPK